MMSRVPILDSSFCMLWANGTSTIYAQRFLSFGWTLPTFTRALIGCGVGEYHNNQDHRIFHMQSNIYFILGERAWSRRRCYLTSMKYVVMNVRVTKSDNWIVAGAKGYP
jgi:hypothetical protein